MKKVTLFFVTCSFITANAIAQHVGIGTNSPETRLHVVDVYDVANGSDGTYINVQNATLFSPLGTLSGIRFKLDGVNSGLNSRYKAGILFEKTSSFGVGSLHFATNALGNNTSITNADARMTINSIGNVGIGTTTPNHRLHIAGGDLFLQSSSGYFKIGYDGGDQWRYATTGGGAHLMMQSSLDGNTFTPQHYFAQNGNLGIGTGTTTPIARLDVKTTSTSSTTSAFMLRNSNNDTLIRVRDNGYMGIGYNGPSYGRPLNIEGGGMNYYYNQATYGGSIFPNSDGSLNLWAPSSSINLQPTAGAVTIGTYTPAVGYLLSVDGKVICEEARVQISGSWPDYVFDKKYQLRSIEDVEKYIQLKGHLPNMPPAATVEKDGLDLGDMNKRLLEKVEELTLYIIDLSKENKALSQRISALENN